jgi:hypothetical protein
LSWGKDREEETKETGDKGGMEEETKETGDKGEKGVKNGFWE